LTNLDRRRRRKKKKKREEEERSFNDDHRFSSMYHFYPKSFKNPKVIPMFPNCSIITPDFS
jgi:hypothetical protein